MNLFKRILLSHRTILLGLVALALPFPRLLTAPPPNAPGVPAALPPQVELLQPDVMLTLLAEHPALVTPTGIESGSLRHSPLQ